MRNIMERYAESPKIFRKPLWKIWHKYLLGKDLSYDVTCLNYGYADLVGNDELPGADENRIKEHYCLQLYDQVVQGIQLANKIVLEIGCGRGGGAAYLMKKYSPATYLATDISAHLIKKNNRHYNQEGLSFAVANAEELKFPDKYYDVVINVESSRCYTDIEGFIHHTHRVLVAGGHICFTDLRYIVEYPDLRSAFLAQGFEIVEERDITKNVVKALQLDNERRKTLVSEKLPKILENSAMEFAGIEGSRRYQLFKDGEMGYYKLILRKS